MLEIEFEVPLQTNLQISRNLTKRQVAASNFQAAIVSEIASAAEFLLQLKALRVMSIYRNGSECTRQSA